jgi:hypothetical protein
LDGIDIIGFGVSLKIINDLTDEIHLNHELSFFPLIVGEKLCSFLFAYILSHGKTLGMVDVVKGHEI